MFVRIYMGGLVLGVNTLYMLSCFLKQFALVGKGFNCTMQWSTFCSASSSHRVAKPHHKSCVNISKMVYTYITTHFNQTWQG